jgi:hypothetical protein
MKSTKVNVYDSYGMLLVGFVREGGIIYFPGMTKYSLTRFFDEGEK